MPPLPSWNLSGILPPYSGIDPTEPAQLSPYETDIVDCAKAFVRSPETALIFRGLLRFREDFCSLGITGFQWIAGSFVEDCLAIRGRPPGDVDVVSFFYRPPTHQSDADWAAFCAANWSLLVKLFDSAQSKQTYSCDAYPLDMHLPTDRIVDQTRYWTGLFGHQRGSDVWKGIAKVTLDISRDGEALSFINGLYP